MFAALTLSLATLFWFSNLQALPASTNPDREFHRLLENAKDHPAATNWPALRLAFSKTTAYYPDLEPFDPTPLDQELKSGERAAALVLIDRLLEGRWVEPEPHFYAALACDQLGETARRDLHLAFGRGLRAAMTTAGDGRSVETAYPVLFPSEEAYLLRYLVQANPSPHTQVQHKGRHYHAHTVTTAPDHDLTIYFDVEIPWKARLARQISGPGLNPPQP